MPADALIAHTVTRFPRFARGGVRVEPVEKGGSDRKYYRVETGGEKSLILVKYGDGREENRHYVEIARFLAGLGVNVPEIFFHDEAEQLIWMEDLGDTDLWSFRDEPWAARRRLYAQTLEELVALHARGHHAAAASELNLQGEFNADLYRWEQHYFFEHCVRGFFQTSADDCDNDVLQTIAARLDAEARVLVHRDFQSQNILINDDCAHLIDFQGLRPGLAPYDLASLLYDPYVTLSAAEREELLALYLCKAVEAGMPIPSDFRGIYDLCAMQRLMQALGAYGFLGLVKERPQFLAHIPAALGSLKEVVARVDGLRELPKLLAGLVPSPPSS